MLADIDNECEGLGCNRTDFIKEAVQDKLDGKSQDQEVIEDTKPEPKITIKDLPEPKKESKATLELISKVKEPKVIIEEVPQDNSNKPIVNFVPFNGQLLPFAKRYDI